MMKNSFLQFLMVRMRWACTCLALYCLAAVSIRSQTVARSIPAQAFLDSLGVNVHMEYTDSEYANTSNVLNDLSYLGVHNVRDNVPRPSSWLPTGQGINAIHALGSVGIRFDICVSDTDLATDITQLVSLQTFHPGLISAIEGPNEINNSAIAYSGLGGQRAAQLFQRDLYAAAHSKSELAPLPVYYFTGGQSISPAALQGLANYANAHPYPRNGDPPLSRINSEFASGFTNLGEFPKVITEIGYYTVPSSTNWGGVDYLTQAKAMLLTYFDAALAGVQMTYMYQLLDEYVDKTGIDMNKHFGLFDSGNSPKTAAIAIHNLTNYLNDVPSEPRFLPYSISGLPPTGHSLLLSKSDGSFVIGVWIEEPIWDEANQEAIEAPPVFASVCVGSAATFASYDPLTAVSHNIPASRTCVPISVPDHPILLSVKLIKHVTLP